MYWSCNGDDSGITTVNHTITGSGWFGYHTVTVKPAGASDVRIAKATATLNFFKNAKCNFQLNNKFLTIQIQIEIASY